MWAFEWNNCFLRTSIPIPSNIDEARALNLVKEDFWIAAISMPFFKFENPLVNLNYCGSTVFINIF